MGSGVATDEFINHLPNLATPCTRASSTRNSGGANVAMGGEENVFFLLRVFLPRVVSKNYVLATRTTVGAIALCARVMTKEICFVCDVRFGRVLRCVGGF